MTAICGDPQRNIDFYSGFLGLRLVKRTVNFDDPGSYHLYYGDAVGTPGTIMTFFAWTSTPPLTVATGRAGVGQIVTTSFSIPANSLDYWVDRLAAQALDFDGPRDRFGEQVIAMKDPDGLNIELVAHDNVRAIENWDGATVPAEHALRGFRGVTLSLDGYEKTAELLRDVLGFQQSGAEGNRFRFTVGAEAGAEIDLLCQPEGARGRMGVGVTHHIAWRAANEAMEEAWRERLGTAGYDTTPILDRNYFRSVYFREPGGVIFEIATDPPGFTADESVDALGSSLKLPSWLEPRRARIEASLPEIRTPK